MAYVSSARAAEGAQIEIDVRGRVRPAVIMRRPLYRKEA
jgi:glycine cleavage system aminomethyltransferase T